MKLINTWMLLVLLVALVGGLVVYRLRRAAHSAAAAPAHAPQMPWRPSQLEPDTQAGRI